jgi:hypothetical protein
MALPRSRVPPVNDGLARLDREDPFAERRPGHFTLIRAAHTVDEHLLHQ